MNDFDQWMGKHQTGWRAGRVTADEFGTQNGVSRSWILPPAYWEEGLWEGLRQGSAHPLECYLAREDVQKHLGVHNLKSSWVACANLYFPFRETAEDRALIAGFLRTVVSDQIHTVDRVELEYAEDGLLHPKQLLGETGGNRGASQTSPDIAFLVNGETGIVLTESKLTEHSFYRCSARTLKDSKDRKANPNPGRCTNAQTVLSDPERNCHQVVWKRKYWERLRPAIDETKLRKLKACPAAFAGYQLFRQQALAEGYTEKYEMVASTVAYDQRNDTLVNSLQSTGISNFPAGWAALFNGKSRFAAWHHQAWVQWVRQSKAQRWDGWLRWIEARYGY